MAVLALELVIAYLSTIPSQKVLSYSFPTIGFGLALAKRLKNLADSTRGRAVRGHRVDVRRGEQCRLNSQPICAEGHHVTEIYFMDWISNHLFPATDTEHANLVGVIQEDQL